MNTLRISSLKVLFNYLKFDSNSYSLGGNSIVLTFILVPKYRINFWLRINEYLYSKNGFKLVRLLIRNKLMVKYGIDIPSNVIIGKGLKIIHFPSIIVHENVIIGENCRINNNVNVGSIGNGKVGFPVIGNNVTIGASSKLLGDIKVGDNVLIGALSLVNKDIPDNSIVYGIPCKIKERKNN